MKALGQDAFRLEEFGRYIPYGVIAKGVADFIEQQGSAIGEFELASPGSGLDGRDEMVKGDPVLQRGHRHAQVLDPQKVGM